MNHSFSSHGRLDKTPGAIALRLRWYGPGDPKLVFVERKTHNEKWTGEVSVKERFTLTEDEVPVFLNGKYPIAKKKKEMLEKGKSQQEVDEWETLVRECSQVIVSKQLVRECKQFCGGDYSRSTFKSNTTLVIAGTHNENAMHAHRLPDSI